VRMDADGGIKRRVFLRKTDAGLEVWRTFSGPDCDHVLDTRGQGARDDFFTIGVEIFGIEMAMRVDHLELLTG
jgi:hypothetical protein